MSETLAAGRAPPEIKLPVSFTVFPGEVFRASRSWVEKSYPSLTYFNEVDGGGYFATWTIRTYLRIRRLEARVPPRVPPLYLGNTKQ